METKKIVFFIVLILSILAGPVLSQTDINAKVAQLNINNATLNDVIRIFGEPQKYIWNNQTFTKDKLPERFVAAYPNGFNVCFASGRIMELRFEEIDSGYVYAGKIKIGSSLDEVIKAIGQPKKTIEGKQNDFQDGVLYKDIDGRKGYCYYGSKDKSVRMFFTDYKVMALYVTRSGFEAGGGGQKSGFQTVRPVYSVKEFDDVRWKDLSKIKSAVVAAVISTLTFNKKTVWPDTNVLLPGRKPDELLEKAINPGLGVRRLHEQGITGKGVNVAIIDQPLYQDHPEFAGKITAYYDSGCKSESSMHGPAVASLLVGANCGTAPDAKLYYAAAPSWMKDAAYYSKSIDWILEQNAKLPDGQKIRVVSVSAAPSGKGSPFEKNQQMWDEACARAEAKGILVLDCTSHHGIIAPGWVNSAYPEDVAKCMGGLPGDTSFRPMEGRICAPTCPRTTAEQYSQNEFSYCYWGKGGLSWAIPYVAGVLAMGWQVNPELGPEQMKQMLFDSATEGQNGAKVIDPQRFISMVKAAKSKKVSRY